MNLLFVNYGDFTSNSLNHIGAFANRLTLRGHACVVAVPENPETISVIHEPLFTPVTFARALEHQPVFPDRRPADIVHAWTPRENVREFTLQYLRTAPSAALIIHLEDNEAFLIESFAHESLENLRLRSDEELAARLSPQLSHPIRFRNFLRIAHGASYITDRLREFIPEGKPAHRLLPGIDPALYRPQPADLAIRTELGLLPHEKLLVFTGSTTFANLADVRTLLLAVRLINERGTPCKLVRTGINPPELAAELAALGGDHVIDRGFVPKTELGPLLALADVLVQPGTADAFNDYRLPSKIPEFLCAGRPVVLPRANIAHDMEDGRHALLLTAGTPAEIADACLRVFSDAALAQRLSGGAVEFARTHFDLTANTAGLLAFYEQTKAKARPIFSDPTMPASEDVLVVEGDVALRMRAKEQTIARGKEQLRALQTEIAASRDAVASLHVQANYQRAKIEEARLQVEVLRGQLSEAGATTAHVLRDLDSSRAHADEIARVLRQREQKIERMTQSHSWQVTAPLRWLRRVLIDSRRPRSRSVIHRVPADPSLIHQIDEPADWAAMPATGTVRGWVISRNGTAISAVRMRVGERLIEATFGLDRPDVARAHSAHAHAQHSGFSLDYSLTADTAQPLILEALTADGVWRCVVAPNARTDREEPEQDRRDYPTWIRKFDTLSVEKRTGLRARIEALDPAQRPLISVVMPVYNTPEKWLAKAIESVRAQIYPHWELCIADDASTAPHVRSVLDDFARRDARIKITFRAENGHISAASNSALELAQGEFVALLDHDDELAPNALAEVVLTLATAPDADWIYSDEDKIDEAGRRFDPYFKPDFLPDLFEAQNFTSHLSVYRRSLVTKAGGFRAGYEGSQDWDLALRVIDLTSPARIRHIPKVLYHWRAIPGSTALALGEKNYPMVAAHKALSDHFARRNEPVELIRQAGDYWRVKRPRPSPAPLVSLIIPTRNRADLLAICIGSILAKTTYPRTEIIVVDNGSDAPDTLAYLRHLETVGVTILRHDAPFNFSAINNLGVEHAKGELVALLNNDLEVISPEWLDELVSQAVRPGIGCVGAMLYYPDDTIQHAGVLLGVGGVANHAFYHEPRNTCAHFNRAQLVQNYSAVTAACLVVRKQIYTDVGGFNATDLAIAFNDVDFCLRVRAAGYRNLWTPYATLYHHESPSRGSEDTPEKLARFHREVAYMRHTWGPQLDADPAYNPNLSLERPDFSPAFPPR